MSLFGLLLNWRTYVAVAFLLLGAYAGCQHIELEHTRSQFVEFRADTERVAAEAKVKNAQEQVRLQQNAAEALDALQSRFNQLDTKYRSLRAGTGSGTVPALSTAAPIIGTCPRNTEQPNTFARRLDQVEIAILGILEVGDKELAKYVELWNLEKENTISSTRKKQ